MLNVRDMETIFVTISRGIITRNILQTGVIHALVHRGYRVVLITQPAEDSEFVQAFGNIPNVILQPWIERKWRWLDFFLVSLHRGLIYNAKIDLVNKVGVYRASETNRIKYWMLRAFFQPLSTLRFLRDAVRWVDRLLVRAQEHDELFQTYKPVVLFSTNIMEFGDVMYAKAAKKNGVPVIGMPKSWDNLSKMGFRLKPDLMLVWSPYMRDESARFQNLSVSAIAITGVPQFDVYVDSAKKLPSREDFFREIGADTSKHLILYGSEGKTTPQDADVVEMIVDAIRDGRLPNDLQILVRPHFGYRKEIEKFERVRNLPGVILDTFNKPSLCFYDQWDWRKEHWLRLAASLFYSKLVITSASTLTLDATCFDTPVLNVAFDGHLKLPYESSMVHWYDTEHYRPIVQSGVPNMVHSAQELETGIAEALQHPERGAEQREQFRRHFCGPLDGKSAERVAEAVVGFIQRKKSS